MKTRKFNQGNLEVSAIGFGCMGLSHGYGTVPEKEESMRLIRLAYELGCTFFDTPAQVSLVCNGKICMNIREYRNN